MDDSHVQEMITDVTKPNRGYSSTVQYKCHGIGVALGLVSRYVCVLTGLLAGLFIFFF